MKAKSDSRHVREWLLAMDVATEMPVAHASAKSPVAVGPN